MWMGAKERMAPCVNSSVETLKYSLVFQEKGTGRRWNWLGPFTNKETQSIVTQH
jgi:hypothetical protein